LRAVVILNSIERQFRVEDLLIDFVTEGLSRDIPDDSLIASVIEHRREHDGCEPTLVSADLDLKLKARVHGISVVQLPAELRLTDEVRHVVYSTNDEERERTRTFAG
jgi:predicted ribonuclease YlaK